MSDTLRTLKLLPLSKSPYFQFTCQRNVSELPVLQTPASRELFPFSQQNTTWSCAVPSLEHPSCRKTQTELLPAAVGGRFGGWERGRLPEACCGPTAVCRAHSQQPGAFPVLRCHRGRQRDCHKAQEQPGCPLAHQARGSWVYPTNPGQILHFFSDVKSLFPTLLALPLAPRCSRTLPSPPTSQGLLFQVTVHLVSLQPA